MQTAEVLSEIRPRLEAAFGKRLKGVILFGSRARLGLLQGEVDYAINAVPADVRDFEAQKFGLYRNARRKGVAL
jgi:hypothetical protein